MRRAESNCSSIVINLKSLELISNNNNNDDDHHDDVNYNWMKNNSLGFVVFLRRKYILHCFFTCEYLN